MASRLLAGSPRLITEEVPKSRGARANTNPASSAPPIQADGREPPDGHLPHATMITNAVQNAG